MSPEAIETLIDALWAPNPPGATLWAVLDCARDPRIYPLLHNSGADVLCLFSGHLAPELRRVSPHMVELRRESALTRQILEQGWGNRWGIFICIEDCTNLRHHLRKFLRVRTEDGQYLLFRYYDPQVLKIYLTTCFSLELKTVFGPIERFVVEANKGELLMEFRFDGDGLGKRRVRLWEEEVDVC